MHATPSRGPKPTGPTRERATERKLSPLPVSGAWRPKTKSANQADEVSNFAVRLASLSAVSWEEESLGDRL